MKTLIFVLAFLFISISTFSQTNGELSVEVTTSNAGGNYAPRHIIAVWVEDETGNFVKTLLAYANIQKTHLNTWQGSTSNAGVEYNTVDAITGATKTSHSTRSCSWDGTDFNGNLVDDGNYILRMELTDKNATGNYSSFNIIKSDQEFSLTPDDEPSFSNISITWTPDATSVNKSNSVEVKISPNPGTGLFYISGIKTPHFKVLSISGKLLFEGKGNKVDLSNCENGIYLIGFVDDNNQMVVRRLIKCN